MKPGRCGLHACIVLIVLFISVQPVHTQEEVLIDFYDNQNIDDTIIQKQHPNLDPVGFSSYGQTFHSDKNYKLTRVRFAVRKAAPVADPDGYWKAYLYAHDGTFGVDGKPIGEPLAVSAGLSHNSLTGDFIMRDYVFDGSYLLKANTPYCVVVYSLDTPFDANVWAYIAADTDPKNHEGNGIYYRNATWNAPSSRDVHFYVYGIPASAAAKISSNLQLAAALMIGLFIVVFVVHMIYMIESGSGEHFVHLLMGYVVSAIIIVALAAIMLNI